MAKNNFSKYYDQLYIGKDYTKETKYILSNFNKTNKRLPQNILDFGCGTGEHTICFANLGYRILGLDIDDDMIEIAEKKMVPSNLKFRQGDFLKLRMTEKFDLIYSYFYVINYIDDLFYLEQIFKKIYSSLNENGIFAFDFISGNATILSHPQNKVIDIQNGKLRIMGSMTPVFDPNFNTATYKYKMQVYDSGKVTNINNSINQTYWTPSLIKQLMLKSGFKKTLFLKHLTNNSKITPDDYKISVFCYK